MTRSRTRRTARACSSPASTRSSSARPPTTRPTARTSPPAAGATPRQHRHAGATGLRASRTGTASTFGFNTLLGPNAEDDHPAPAQGHPRRDELDQLRRVRADEATWASRRRAPTPLLQNIILYPFVNPATEIIDATELADGRRRRVSPSPRRPTGPDLEDHAQRRGHAPDPLPPVRRAADQPGRLGQHHHPARRQRARLEGHRPGQPARGHDRGPAADRPNAAVRRAQQRPAAQPDDADRLDRWASTTSTRYGNPIAPPITNQWSTSAGSTSGTATS